jgi:hypothetical protein
VQQVIVDTVAEHTENATFRFIRSYAYISDRKPKPELYERLLKDSFKRKSGSWEMDYSDGKYYIFITAKVSADCRGLGLRDILELVALAADEMEASLSKEDKY